MKIPNFLPVLGKLVQFLDVLKLVHQLIQETEKKLFEEKFETSSFEKTLGEIKTFFQTLIVFVVFETNSATDSSEFPN